MKTGLKQPTVVVRKTKPPDKDLRATTKAYVEDAEKAWFNISKNCYLIEQGELWKDWGYESMEQYMLDELGLQYRNMRHRLKIGKTIVDKGLTEEMVTGITEWTKFKAIRPLLESEDLTQDRITFILNEAKEKSVRELERMVQEGRVEHMGGRAVSKTMVRFWLIDEQKATFDRVIEKATSMTGLTNIGQIIEYIFQEWDATNDPHLKEALLKVIAKVPESTNVGRPTGESEVASP